MSNYTLPLFPLNLVIFPEGTLPLRIFEARYLDMIKACLRNNTNFGVVAVVQNQSSDNLSLPFAKMGTNFSIENADVTDLGMINIRCLGQHRFTVNSAIQQDDGLWIGHVTEVANDASMEIPEDLKMTQEYIQQLITSLSQQKIDEAFLPFAKPYKVDDCAWVANRWCEILNIPLIQKQRLLELDSPLVRLELVQDLLTAEFARK
ncbi:MAG: LON peptidase substrate-binding domain-containing protein [Methylophilaceae bacterium]|nr:LON peptidase substrate-binding domain-containing protein [Methylophilaceae bacterium]